MLKLWLKFNLIDWCINNTFNGIISSLDSSPKWIKGSDINESHIGMTVLNLNYGILPTRMPLTQFNRCMGAKIVPYEQLDRFRGIVTNFTVMLDSSSDINYLRHIPVFKELMYLVSC